MKSKSAIVLLLLVGSIILVASPGCSPQTGYHFTISGKLDNFQGRSLTLIRHDNLNRREQSEVAKIPVDENGRFSMKFELEPHFYTLNVIGEKGIDLAIDNGQVIDIKADANDLATAIISGSDDTAKLQAYETFRKKSLDRLVITVRDQIAKLENSEVPEKEDKIARLSDQEIINYNEHKDELINFVRDRMSDSIAAYATSSRWDGAHNIPALEGIANAFSAKHKGLPVAERLREKLELIKRNSPGGVVTDIVMPDVDGRSTSLSAVQGKYILIDFWASWCPPCRRESPELTSLYDKYRPLGFDIYGVSLDSERDAWIAAMKNDKRIWANVSDLKEYDTPAAFDYSITALPANFLIDAERKVIARNLHGSELRTKLEELLGK